MTKYFTIMPSATNEGPPETPKLLAFPGLLASLFGMIVAERDLEDISYSQDPAYSAWMRDAEVAQDNLIDTLRKFHLLPVVTPADRPLQHMADVIDTMLGHEEPGSARRLQLRMRMAFFAAFQVPGIGLAAMQCNALLVQALHLVTAFAALPLFDGTAGGSVDDHLGDDWDILTLS